MTGPLRLRRLLRSAGVPREFPPGVLADGVDYAALRELVSRAAARVGAAPPARVVLALEGGATIAGDARSGLTVRVGSPLVVGLSSRDLGIVLAHAMAVLREPHPELAAAVLDARPWSPRPREKSRRLWTELEQRADDAAKTMAGDGTGPPADSGALTALLRADALTWHFTWYLLRYLTAPSRMDRREDLLADWLESLARPVPHWAVHSVLLSGLARGAEAHPGFGYDAHSVCSAVRATAMADGLAPAPGTTVADRIAETDLLRLTSQLQVDPGDSPENDYAAIERDILRAATALSGHDATVDDALRLIELGRGPDLARSWHETAGAPSGAGLPNWWTVATPGAPAQSGPPTTGEVLEVLVAAASIRRGLHYDGILNPGRLTAGDAPAVDVYAAVDDALRDDRVDLTALARAGLH